MSLVKSSKSTSFPYTFSIPFCLSSLKRVKKKFKVYPYHSLLYSCYSVDYMPSGETLALGDLRDLAC